MTSASTARNGHPGGLQLMDVAPAILQQFGIPVPAGMAGSAISRRQRPAISNPLYLPRLSRFEHRAVPLEERTVEGVQQRHPDFIVISSAAKKGITHRWNPDWRQGHTLLVPAPGAPAFLDALENERLPYRRVAHFEQHPRLLRVRITSLCPEISVFQRVP